MDRRSARTGGERPERGLLRLAGHRPLPLRHGNVGTYGAAGREGAAADRANTFVHESFIGSLFTGRIEGTTRVGGFHAIIPSIEGWARITGLNTIFIDDRDPYRHGFQVV